MSRYVLCKAGGRETFPSLPIEISAIQLSKPIEGRRVLCVSERGLNPFLSTLFSSNVLTVYFFMCSSTPSLLGEFFFRGYNVFFILKKGMC